MTEQGEEGISAKEMYDMVNRNYEWEGFKYQIPRQYFQGEKKVAPGSRPPHKLNYIDDVLRIKKFVPAPNKYEIKENSRPLSGKMDKNPRKTLAEAIIHQNRREPSPGPASYFTRPRTAEAKINKNAPEYREHYLHEVEYLSSECPGVGEYNVNYVKSDHIASPKYHKAFASSKSTSALRKEEKGEKAEKGEKGEKGEELSRTVVAGTFDWIASQKKTASKNYFGKSKRFVAGGKF